MTHRQFRDDRGSLWDVWDVHPMGTERRQQSERRIGDRRQRDDGHVIGVPLDLRSGWLAFQAGVELRRLIPIPRDWNSLPEDELRILKDRAVPSDRARNLVRETS